jgi:hypothetical protein
VSKYYGGCKPWLRSLTIHPGVAARVEGIIGSRLRQFLILAIRRSESVQRLKRLLVITCLLLSVVYVCDYVSVRFRIPKSREPFGTVNVQRYYAVKQKDGKTEFMFDPPENQVCVHSLFPHLGYTPCWYLSRSNPQRINM